jgi:hypothetical protein
VPVTPQRLQKKLVSGASKVLNRYRRSILERE